METHSNIFAWKIPRTQDPGGLQSMVSQRVGHDWETEKFKASLFYNTLKAHLLKDVISKYSPIWDTRGYGFNMQVLEYTMQSIIVVIRKRNVFLIV